MIVGLSAYLLHDGRDYRTAGVSTYVRRLLENLPVVAPEHRYLAFHGRDSSVPPKVESRESVLATNVPGVRIAWEQVVLPIGLVRDGVTVVHGTVNVLPMFSRRPSVVTVHDLAFLRFPDRFPQMKARYLRAAVSLSVRSATRVIAVSGNTRKDLVELLGADPARVTVIHLGVAAAFRPLPQQEVEAFRRGHFGGRPYILHVGTLEPRKNLDILIRAYSVQRARGIPHCLVLVGARGWMFENLFALVSSLSLEEDVKFVDYVPSGDLPLWYNCADLFTYPSAYEGFGLPVLEAMACGVPAVTSASSSLQELAGDACLTVQPGSQEDLEVAIGHALHSEELRLRLRTAGLTRASQFSWEETAARTVGVYEEVARESAA